MPEKASEVQDTITLMVMQGPAGRIRRVSVRRSSIQRLLISAAVVFCVALAVSVDYVRVRVQVAELEDLRHQAAQQTEHIEAYATQVEAIAGELARLGELEHKLRVMTSLDPGSRPPLPGVGGPDGDGLSPDHAWLTRAQRHRRLVEGFSSLHSSADSQVESLEALLAHLEENSAKLLHTPSIQPTKGWMTSTFGYRTSPFTGRREFHRGIDIAGRTGTPVLATADGVVHFAGTRRALGKAVVIRHGYGVETKFGHLHEVLVKSGEKVRRGQKVGLMGSTGRSTGPHLHYQVEVNRKPVNPQNYIVD